MVNNSTLEIVQCPNCNSIVPKRLYCRKCGKVLLNATSKTLSESAIKNEDLSADVDQDKDTSKKKLSYPADRSALEQLQQIRQEAKLRESSRQAAVEVSSPVDQESLEEDNLEATDVLDSFIPKETELTMKQPLSEQNKIDEEKIMAQKNEPKGYTPDLYVKEIVEKMAKSVKYEVNLVQLLQEGQMTEEIFTRLFNGMADETHGLITRREEVLNELISLMKGYESTVLSAQQGMKLLDLRKSIGDASEEEFVVKSSALNWDIKNYGNRILDGRQRSDYLKSLGKLIPEEELKELENLAAKYSKDVSSINVSKVVQERIMKAMQEATSLLSEASEF
jgi:hypothetical protein